MFCYRQHARWDGPALDQHHAAGSCVQVTREGLKLRHLSVPNFSVIQNLLADLLDDRKIGTEKSTTTTSCGQAIDVLLPAARPLDGLHWIKFTWQAAAFKSLREFEATPSFCPNFSVIQNLLADLLDDRKIGTEKSTTATSCGRPIEVLLPAARPLDGLHWISVTRQAAAFKLLEKV